MDDGAQRFSLTVEDSQKNERSCCSLVVDGSHLTPTIVLTQSQPQNLMALSQGLSYIGRVSLIAWSLRLRQFGVECRS
ncbi:hypothetical protein CsatA_030943 [Cannabis sativa]